jgi:hypothetical protein
MSERIGRFSLLCVGASYLSHCMLHSLTMLLRFFVCPPSCRCVCLEVGNIRKLKVTDLESNALQLEKSVVLSFLNHT